MTPGRIEKGSKSGQSIKIMKTECYYKKVIQRLSSREEVGMHLPCLWPDFDILIIDVGIVYAFHENVRILVWSLPFFFATASVYQCLMKHLNFVKS